MEMLQLMWRNSSEAFQASVWGPAIVNNQDSHLYSKTKQKSQKIKTMSTFYFKFRRMIEKTLERNSEKKNHLLFNNWSSNYNNLLTTWRQFSPLLSWLLPTHLTFTNSSLSLTSLAVFANKLLLTPTTRTTKNSANFTNSSLYSKKRSQASAAHRNSLTFQSPKLLARTSNSALANLLLKCSSPRCQLTSKNTLSM